MTVLLKEAIDARKRLENLLNEKALYAREMEAAKKKIREVGTIDSNEFVRYKDLEVKQLYEELKNTQNKLQVEKKEKEK